jgi:hypothetical protein
MMLKEEKELRDFIRTGAKGWFNGAQVTHEARGKIIKLITALVRAVREDDAKFLKSFGDDSAAYALRGRK